jgi:hypothetical protein
MLDYLSGRLSPQRLLHVLNLTGAALLAPCQRKFLKWTACVESRTTHHNVSTLM